MTFAELYKDHAYADLIQEAETQGIGMGVEREQARIIKLLEEELLSDDDSAWQTRDWAEVERQQDQDWVIKEAIALIKGQTDCSCRPEGQCLYHKALAKIDGENK